MYTLTVINGELTKSLLNGGKIIAAKCTGFDFYVLVENKKGSEWAFQQYQTLIASTETNTFSLMVSYNWPRKASEKLFWKDFYEDMVTMERCNHHYNSVINGTTEKLLSEISTKNNSY